MGAYLWGGGCFKGVILRIHGDWQNVMISVIPVGCTVPNENPVEAILLFAVAAVNEANAGADGADAVEASDSKAEREEVVVAVALG